MRLVDRTWRPDSKALRGGHQGAFENALRIKKSRFRGDFHARSNGLLDALNAITSGFHVKLQQLAV